MRFFLVLLSTIFLSLLFPIKTNAANPDDFRVQVNTTVEVSEKGVATVIQEVGIINNKDFVYAPSYSIFLGYPDIQNLEASNESEALPVERKKRGNSIGEMVTVLFPEKIIGKDKEVRFTLQFQTESISRKTGSVWEISMPGLSDPKQFETYNIKIKTPSSFGNARISKPHKNHKKNSYTYEFSKSDIKQSGILLIFGSEQYYKFELSYHISNPNFFPITERIALPPNTAYQEVIVESISEEPHATTVDMDNNHLVSYRLAPHEKKDIRATVFIKTYSSPQTTLSSVPDETYISPKKYWDSQSSEVKDMAERLKTPENIYSYVVSNLTYNYEKISESNVRLGAKGVLRRPDFAVCLEFTDLFIALSRAAGIPARAVEGYAFTENSTLRPLSLVRDVLHSWPEYYHAEKKQWIMVDPTWGNTTKGLDYFYSIDFDHVVFSVKGTNSSYPVPAGAYKSNSDSKDVVVSFISEEEFEAVNKVELTAFFPDFSLSAIPVKGSVRVRNSGNAVISDTYLVVESDLLGEKTSFLINNLPPKAEREFDIQLTKVPFLTNGRYPVTIQLEGKSLTREIHISPYPKKQWLLLGGAFVSGSICCIVIAHQARRLFVQRRKR